MAKTRRKRIRLIVPALLLGGCLAVLAAKGCSSPPSIANRDPSGDRFPQVTGQSLEKEPVTLPDDLAGAPAVLLVGYVQGTQFDLDRWLMGLLQAEVNARIIELPTIPGLVATAVSGWIDDGMRSGIPPEDWASVVTLYGDAARPVAELTGTDNPRRARVLVLDGSGTVVWFDDAGFSARKVLELAALVRTLDARADAPDA